jgi:6-phosphogluconolactonase (cycloisomerase 2 family)
MALPIKKEKLNRAFFLLSIIIIIILAVLLFQKKFRLYFKNTPFSLKLIRVIGSTDNLKGPAGAAFGKRNNVYIVDSGNSRILKFNIKGGYIRQWGIEGKATGEFMAPLFAAVNQKSREIYIVDSGNSRIQVFKPDGNFVSEFGISKNSKRMLVQPTFVGFAHDKIYVANSGSGNVMIYLKNGQFYERKGNSSIQGGAEAVNAVPDSSNGGSSQNSSGNAGKKNANNAAANSAGNNVPAPAQAVSPVILKKPVSIAFSKKYIYISDYKLSKILVFNRQFDYIGSIGTPGETGYQLYHPVGIVYKNGYLYVANYGRSILTVFKLDNGYNVIKTYNFGTPGIGRYNFNHESNIAVSLNGKYLAVADTNNNRILIYRIFGAK